MDHILGGVARVLVVAGGRWGGGATRPTLRANTLAFGASTLTWKPLDVLAVRAHMKTRRGGVGVEAKRVRVEAMGVDVDEGRRGR